MSLMWTRIESIAPSGRLLQVPSPLSKAKSAGWALLVLGVVIAAVSGYLPGDGVEATWLPAVIAVALAVMIVAYDGPLKSTHAAPAAMGACRVLSFLLGAAPCLLLTADGPLIPKYLLGIAFGFGVYIMGVTTMARHEATGGATHHLAESESLSPHWARCAWLSRRNLLVDRWGGTSRQAESSR